MVFGLSVSDLQYSRLLFLSPKTSAKEWYFIGLSAFVANELLSLTISATILIPSFHIYLSASLSAAARCSGVKLSLTPAIAAAKPAYPTPSAIVSFRYDNSLWQCALVKPGQRIPEKNSTPAVASRLLQYDSRLRISPFRASTVISGCL